MTAPKARPSILGRDRAELENLAASLPVDPEALPDAQPVDQMADFALAEYIVKRLSDDALRALPEVEAAMADPNIDVRDVRGDYEAAALGAMVEADREAAARWEAENHPRVIDPPEGSLG